MTENRDKLNAELQAAGVRVKALGAGRVVLADGTVRDPDGTLWHEREGEQPDAAAAAVVANVLRDHDPAPTAAQLEREQIRNGGGAPAALACVLEELQGGAAAPAWARAVVARLAQQGRGG